MKRVKVAGLCVFPFAISVVSFGKRPGFLPPRNSQIGSSRDDQTRAGVLQNVRNVTAAGIARSAGLIILRTRRQSTRYHDADGSCCCGAHS
ncbi:hypothetical protein DFJ74DRAFT_695129 [Hyaloraphidium curvatum]|nr:hypothetical protein DFJ74DRAFT_695129 [Hyaloraphidium curvatum]